jgi:hypothetical protein
VTEAIQAFINPDQPFGEPEWGYWLNFNDHGDQVLHDFCGEHNIVGAFCPNCERPFTRLLSLTTNDTVLNLDPDRLAVVHLLYCWTCSIPFGDFCYRIRRDGAIDLLTLPPRQREAEHGLEGPYDGYTGVFPHRKVSLEFISDQAQSALRTWWHSTQGDIDKLGDLGEPRHQVGGYPFIYNPRKTKCPECDQDMPLFAAVCNDAAGNDPWRTTAHETFVDNGAVQMIFHLCRKCSIVSAYHSCS